MQLNARVFLYHITFLQNGGFIPFAEGSTRPCIVTVVAQQWGDFFLFKKILPRLCNLSSYAGSACMSFLSSSTWFGLHQNWLSDRPSDLIR
jgi:hypothetical protein